MNVQLITINPWFYTALGHNQIYLQSVENASKILGWDFKALVPKKNILTSLPNNWIKCIDCPTVRHWFEVIEKKPYKRARKLIRSIQRVRYYNSLFLSLKKLTINRKSKKHNILFFETFSTSDIQLITNLLLFFPQQNFDVWLLYRYPSSFMQTEMDQYIKCHKKLSQLGFNLKLLTDSDLLAEDLSIAFKKAVHVFPIPHVGDLNQKTIANNSKIHCWWPGIVREGKGKKIIQDFAASNHPENPHFKLFVSENADLMAHENGPEIFNLPSDLSREEYIKCFAQSNLILLPYIDSCYKKATSGIFAESIMTGNIPVVYPDTWMAYELQKYSLDELIIDWDKETLSQKLFKISQNKNIKEKIKYMQNEYQLFHSINNFANKMKKMFFDGK